MNGRWVSGSCLACDRAESINTAAHDRQEAQYLSRLSTLELSGIPKRFQTKTFDDYKDDCGGKQKAKRMCELYCDKFAEVLDNGTCMILCGKPGTGKTHLACAIGNKLIASGRSLLFVGAYRAIQQVKETYHRGSEQTERGVIDGLVDLDLLILDEIGVQYGSESEKIILFEIINRRYEEVKPTILISNLVIDDLTKYVGLRVLDRMREGGGPIVAFDWDSARLA